ncbi:Uncharacterized protein PHSC3_000724 [Chlamydiales bacterium STE3]|nr:Uncharacterized protein PHSC3_000724 [Chlamydiales bacterium STE3]
MLSEKSRQLILELQKKYPHERSALIPALHVAQAEKGYLPIEVQQEVAELFEIALNEVNSVVTFYDMFFEKPVGKHLLHVCKNVSCMLRGADQLMEKLCHKLEVKPGETSQDQEFTLLSSECLGACDKAPMMLVDDHVFGPIKEEDVDQILEKTKKSLNYPSLRNTMEDNHG